MKLIDRKPINLFQVGLMLLLFLVIQKGFADDIDIFNNPPGDDEDRPNVLIVLDSGPNWNPYFDNEQAALMSVVENLTDRFNVGLMMFTETSGDRGTYVRFAVSPMTNSNRVALLNLVNSLDVAHDRAFNARIGLALDEAYRYYAGTTVLANNSMTEKHDPRAVSGSRFISPIVSGSCANNYIIYISNGFVSDDADSYRKSREDLQNFGGDTTLIMPPDTGSGSRSMMIDEYSRFMYKRTTTSPYKPFPSFPGANVITYTVEIDPRTEPMATYFTNVMKSTARQGGGRYFKVVASAGSVTASLVEALNSIFREIQSKNSVFASATLPINAGTQGVYLNQVYMGVFRPDRDRKPLWLGNLKQYKFGISSDDVLELVDSVGLPVASSTTGFVLPDATSFWTKESAFWNYTAETFAVDGSIEFPAARCPHPQPSGSTGGYSSDCPDGPWVEKGGAAQRLRTVYATTPTNRVVYTCINGSACTTGALSALFSSLNCASASPVNLSESSSDNCLALKNWVLGQDNWPSDSTGGENENGDKTDVRASIHGDVLHSQPAVINYGTVDSPDIWVFYGSNDGIFHAVKGGQGDCATPSSTSCPGTEQWGFIPPEFYGKLKRLRDHSPLVNFPSAVAAPSDANNKPYFMDGSVTTYKDGNTAYLFMTMRRGGRSIYALDVSNKPDDSPSVTPGSPRFLWKKTNTDTDYGELGYTWSAPRPYQINVGGVATSVLVFGAGYDPAADDGTADRSMGRGVFIINPSNGAVIKAFGTSDGIAHSIPGNITGLDYDKDGIIDRFYAADTGGNVWRIKYQVNDDGTTTWTINKLASLAGLEAANARRFLFEPDVVLYDKNTSPPTYAVLIGSGDREKPSDTTVVNRFYMLIDRLDNGITGTIAESDLLDATSSIVTLPSCSPPPGTCPKKGWFITLGTGEKVTGRSVTIAGTIVFGTNLPTPSDDDDDDDDDDSPIPVCTGNLGEARRYAVNFRTASATERFGGDTSSTENRYQVAVGGGLLPSPIAGVVLVTNSDGKLESRVFVMDNPANPGGVMEFKIPINPERDVIYWYQEKKD